MCVRSTAVSAAGHVLPWEPLRLASHKSFQVKLHLNLCGLDRTWHTTLIISYQLLMEHALNLLFIKVIKTK